MSLKEDQAYVLNKLIGAISTIDEVIAIILFGSIARGDYDEYSDYDVLVIFKDRESMWRRWNDLFKTVGKLGLLIHLIPKGYEEFLNGERTFLNELYKDGKLLYAKYPFQAYLRPLGAGRKKMIIYDLRGLKQTDKMKVLHRIYGKPKNPGMLKKLGGVKLCDGCILMPAEDSEPILEVLQRYRAKMRTFEVYVQ